MIADWCIQNFIDKVACTMTRAQTINTPNLLQYTNTVHTNSTRLRERSRKYRQEAYIESSSFQFHSNNAATPNYSMTIHYFCAQPSKYGTRTSIHSILGCLGKSSNKDVLLWKSPKVLKVPNKPLLFPPLPCYQLRLGGLFHWRRPPCSTPFPVLSTARWPLF